MKPDGAPSLRRATHPLLDPETSPIVGGRVNAMTSPPTEVAPFAEDSSGTTRPPSVSKAVAMLFVTLGLGILRYGLILKRMADDAYPIRRGSVIGQICIFAGLGILYFFIGRRRNLARFIYALWAVLFIAMTANALRQSAPEIPFVGVVMLGQTALQLWALVLLFRPEAAAWFKRMPLRQ
jgi:hypothetical protein